MEFVADFETTSVRFYNEINVRENGQLKKIQKLDRVRSRAFVCAWAIIPVQDEPDAASISRGRTIESFLAYCENLYNEVKKTTKQKAPKVNIYTHNLKFDGDFILYHILKYKTAELTRETRENVLYNFSIKFPSGAEINFYDSMKIFPVKAEKLGKLYGIKKLVGEWNYTKYRDETTPISPEEWAYVDHDVMIISRALADYRARGYRENTQAAIAYNERLRRTYPRFRKLTAVKVKRKEGFDAFRSCFPYDIQPLEYDLHKHLLLGYFGGISWLNPKYACQDLVDAHSYDVHSMYPDKMRNYPLPVGYPTIVENPTPEEADRILSNYNCVMADFEELSITLKSPRHFPFLMFPTDDETSVRMQGKIIDCRNELAVLSNWDYRIMKSEYNIHSMKITKLYLFRSKIGQYADFVDFFMNQKTEADKIRNDPAASADDKQNAEVLRNIAKVMLNSSYGKDGTKLLRTNNKTIYDPALDVLEQEANADISEPEYYLPSAIFICAHARYQLFKAAILVRDDFIYSDTDSVKVTSDGNEILKNNPKFDVDPYRLGSWGYEGKYDTARFVRQKTYSYTQDGERHYTVCGAPDSVKLTFKIDDFLPGMIISLEDLHKEGREGRLLPVRVPGGVILEETGFQIAKVDNWDEYNGRNMPIDYKMFCDIIGKKNLEKGGLINGKY